jgi:hypothetical protein
MEDIRDSHEIIDVSGLGPDTLSEQWAIGAASFCMTRTVWDRAIEPPGTHKRFIPNRLSSLCSLVVGHLQQQLKAFSQPGVFIALPFILALDSYDEDFGEYFPSGLENSEEFPYPAALKVELLVYHTLRRRPCSGQALLLTLLITMTGENLPEYPPLRSDEIDSTSRAVT